MSTKYHFFWGGPFSNWHIAPFIINSIKYNCVEQYMMANKAIMSKDLYTLGLIMNTDSPREQKALGRKVQNFDVDKWSKESYGVVFTGNMEKYTTHSELRKLLLDTGDDILVEASPYDRIWGIGYSAEDALKNISDWGENRLGKVLMEVRENLKNVA
jgi:ribA/ribD-fused uncharacterized protein